MAEMRLGSNLNFNNHELLNAVIHKSTTAGRPAAPTEGQLYYDTDVKTLYVHIGPTASDWLDLGDIYSHPTYSTFNPDLDTNGASVLATFETDETGHVIAATTRLMTLADLGYTGDTDANNYVHATFAGNDLGAALSGATIISDVDVNSEGHVTGFTTRDLTPADIGAAVINDSITNLTDTWSSQKIQDELDAINSTVAGALVYQGGFNASTNTPNLASTPTGINKGFTYTVTTAGTFYTTEVQVGDMLIAEIDDPATEADWTIVNKNIPDIVSATTDLEGLIELATQAEVDAGSDATKAVTPLTLKQRMDAFFSDHRYATNIGDGTTTTFPISHNLGSSDVQITLREVSSGNVWWTEETITDDNTITVKFNTAPTANQFRVNINK
jgi:hypothetical protein